MDHAVATQIDDSLIMNYTALLRVVINVYTALLTYLEKVELRLT